MTDQERPAHEADSPPPANRVLLSKDLLDGQNSVLIRHENEYYRLLQTKNGKLILQK